VDPVTQLARAWVVGDPDPASRAALQALLGEETSTAKAALHELFDAPLRFGTAGLRGALGPGPGRMNLRVVELATLGVAAYVTDHVENGPARGVVIGHDARHHSARFAKHAADVLRARGIAVHVLSGPLPTPLVPFTLRQISAAAGIMITASHNPATDNGFKLYDCTGVQALPDVCALVEEVMAEKEVLAPQLTPLAPRHEVQEEMLARYQVHMLTALAPLNPADLTICYSALHGVGFDTLHRLLSAAGFAEVHPLTSQCTPNPDFPNMPFPNPEEPGVLDELLNFAKEKNADLALANDPDADRLAVCVPTKNGWRMLSGDEVGWLLGWHLLSAAVTPQVVTSTVVSSSRLLQLAEHFGATHVETLTGFKWVARAASPLLFGYEEALGYAVDPAAVGDKDGVSAALALCALASELSHAGRTLTDLLDEMDNRFGRCVTRSSSLRLPAPPTGATIDTALDALARSFSPANLRLLYSEDLRIASHLPATTGLRLCFDDADQNLYRCVVRPSGTESKVKCYVEVRESRKVATTVDLEDAAAALLRDLLAWAAARF